MAISCVVSERIGAPADVVFAAASDFAGAARRISGIKKVELLTDGPVGVGTRFRETRVMLGKEATETMEVIDFQPGRSYTLGANSCGSEYRTVVRVQPSGAGSEVTFDFSATARTLGARAMGALMGWMMKGACVKAIRRDLSDLKAAVERDAAVGAAAGR